MRKRFLAVLLALTCLAGTSGCAILAAGAVAGGGTYAYVSGWGERSYAVDLDKAFDASMAACKRLDLTVEKRSRSLSDASIKAHDADDTSVWINLEAKNTNITHVKVRVGVLGDEAATQRIHAAIDNALAGR